MRINKGRQTRCEDKRQDKTRYKQVNKYKRKERRKTNKHKKTKAKTNNKHPRK